MATRSIPQLKALIESAKRLSFYDDVAEWEAELAEAEKEQV